MLSTPDPSDVWTRPVDVTAFSVVVIFGPYLNTAIHIVIKET